MTLDLMTVNTPSLCPLSNGSAFKVDVLHSTKFMALMLLV